MSKKVLLAMILLIIGTLGFLITGCAGNTTQSSKPEGGEIQKQAPKVINAVIYTPGVGGSAYILSAGFAKLLQEKLDNVVVSVEATEGDTAKVRYIKEKYDKGVPAFGASAGHSLIDAYTGNDPYKEPFDMLRFVTLQNSVSVYPVVREKSSIKNYQDFIGKRVAVGAAGSGTAFLMEDVLAKHGLESKYTKLYLQYDEVVRGLQDNSLDVGVLAGGYPLPSFNELSVSTPVRIIPLTDEKVIEAIHERYIVVKVPAGSYDGRVKEEVLVPGFASVYSTHARTPEDFVYNMVKTWYEEKEKLIRVHAAAKEIAPENALLGKGKNVPLHPGAEKYYKEIRVLK